MRKAGDAARHERNFRVGEQDAGFLEILRSDRPWYLPAIALGEYRFGVVSSTRRAALEQWLTEVEVACVVLAPDAGTARHYAAIRDTLRRANTPIRRVGW
jgi:predicted nucleic acid-binding protein